MGVANVLAFLFENYIIELTIRQTYAIKFLLIWSTRIGRRVSTFGWLGGRLNVRVVLDIFRWRIFVKVLKVRMFTGSVFERSSYDSIIQ